MRQDRIFKRRVREFISESLKDVRKSEKGVFRYFNPSFKNKKLFKYNAAWAALRPGHAGSLFGNDSKSVLRWNNLTEIMFAQMMREAKLRRVYLLMPNKDGEFRSSQQKLLARFTDVILSKMEAREAVLTQNEAAKKTTAKGKTKTRAEIEEIITKTQKNLEEHGKLETISQLSYNEKTGLIEGRVANIMDNDGTALKTTIDPENADLILFSNTDLGMCFAMDNNEKDLALFLNNRTDEMVNKNNIEAGTPMTKEEEAADNVDVLDSEVEGIAVSQIEKPETDVNKAVATYEVMQSFLHEDLANKLNNKLNNELSAQRGLSIPEERARIASPQFLRRFTRNPAFESTLKGETPMPKIIRGADGLERERVGEKDLAKREEEKAIKNNLNESEQASLKKDEKSEEEQKRKQKQKTGPGINWVAWIAAGGIGIDLI